MARGRTGQTARGRGRARLALWSVLVAAGCSGSADVPEVVEADDLDVSPAGAADLREDVPTSNGPGPTMEGAVEVDAGADTPPDGDAAADVRIMPEVSPAPTPLCPESRPETEQTVTLSGGIWIFDLDGGPLGGAEVFLLEDPAIATTSEANGTFVLEGVPAWSEATLVMLHEGYPENQTGTLCLADQDVSQIAFQAVPQNLYDFFATITGATDDPSTCQLASTVTRHFEGGLPAVHGEPAATVTTEPPLPATHGPIYFNEAVVPDVDRTETSVDGGVAFVDVPPGQYVLRAHKPGVTFSEVYAKCRPGVLVNAAPPKGIQAQ